MMKTINFTLLLLLFNLISANISAQLTKTATWLGGSLGYSSSNSESQLAGKVKTKSFTFSPAIGKVIKQNLVAGVELVYNFYSEKRSNTPQDTKNNLYGAGVFVRKYVEPIKRFYLFAHAGISGSIVRYKTDNSFNADSETKGWQAGISLYPGVSYALNSKVFLEAVFTNLSTVAILITKQRFLMMYTRAPILQPPQT